MVSVIFVHQFNLFCLDGMDSSSLVSVIIPVHNTAGYLRKCVDSVRNQSLKELEIILVDNLSVDGSSEMCDEYAQADSRIKVLHLSVAGLSVARNAGIDVATSPYIGFIDSDDYIAPTMYQEILDALIQNQADIGHCNIFLESYDKPLVSPFPNSGNVYVQSQWETLRDMMQGRGTCSSCNKLFKKELFASLRFPEGRLYEDLFVMHEWLVLCQRIVWVDKAFYYYVARETSISHTIVPLNRYHFFLAQYSYLEFINKHALFEGKELVEVRSRIISMCYSLFCEVMQMTKPKYFREPVEDMKSKFQELRSLSCAEIDKKCYKRIRKITCYWPIYYFFRFCFRKREWRG